MKPLPIAVAAVAAFTLATPASALQRSARAKPTVPIEVAAGPAAQGKRAIKPGPWKKRHVPEGWVLHITKRRNYQIQSQAGLDKARRLGAHMEAMLKVYKRLFPPQKNTFKQYAIKLFKDRSAFRAYGGPPGAGAYYSAGQREMVCYDTGKWMDAPPPATTGAPDPMALQRRYRMDILGAAAHEGWHQYFHWYITSWVPIPSWINEGMGDYFYCARPLKVKGHKVPAKLGRLNAMRLPIIWRAVRDGKHVPIAELLHYSQRDYYGNASVCYAEGWALCQFLLHSGNKKYARVIPKFVRLVESDTNMKVVTRKAFRGIDLDRLEKEWKAWILGPAIKRLRGKQAMPAGGR